MLAIRIVLIVIFGLLLAALLFGLIRHNDPSKSLWGAAAFFSAIIAVLGPLWPSKQRLENANYNLPTDDPRVAAPLLMLALGLLSLWCALDNWMYPSSSHARLAEFVYILLGNSGLILVEAVIGIFCLLAAYAKYKEKARV